MLLKKIIIILLLLFILFNFPISSCAEYKPVSQNLKLKYKTEIEYTVKSNIPKSYFKRRFFFNADEKEIAPESPMLLHNEKVF